ncbi:MAG: hypothetical protein ACKO3W_08630, partial [bacterium]
VLVAALAAVCAGAGPFRGTGLANTGLANTGLPTTGLPTTGLAIASNATTGQHVIRVMWSACFTA